MYITVPIENASNNFDFMAFLLGGTIESRRNITHTRTYIVDVPTAQIKSKFSFSTVHSKLVQFNQKYESYINEPDKSKFYYSFNIPKSSGGLRRIDAPNDDLKAALRELKDIFAYNFKVLYHNNAYAYIKGRSTVDAVRVHQKNSSHWFLKKDIHGFFPSTTLDFLVKMFGMVFPFATYIDIYGDSELRKALSMCFLNGGLPQGTPISPLLTNIMMIPIDYEISQYCYRQTNPHIEYTRYCDDSFFSSRVKFDAAKVSKDIEDIYKRFDTPFEFNEEKNRFGSSAGKNWMLGVMLNKDNNITVGHTKKKNFKNQIFRFGKDFANGIIWSVGDVQSLMGVYAQFKNVEGKAIDEVVKSYSEKCNVNIVKAMKHILGTKYTGNPKDYAVNK